jgi:predicted secreted Zn-dependent protease
MSYPYAFAGLNPFFLPMHFRLLASAVVALLSVSLSPTHAQTVKGGTLHWSAKRPLVLADFQGRPRPNEAHAALTSATVVAQVACKSNKFTGSVQAAFDPTRSWVRDPATITAKLLRHEQLHFDIAEVYARRLRQKLTGTQIPCAQLGTMFERLSNGIYADWEKAEDQYDRDTNHGLIPAQQQAWEARVQQQLAELEAFAEAEG